MGAAAGGLLRFVATFLYALEFCCAGIILGVYSYFLAVLKDHNLPIANKWRAVEGISGSAVLYLIFAVILTCFLGGKRFFAFIAIVLDVLFCAAFIALAVLLRKGADSCTGEVDTPLGKGPANGGQSGFGANGFGTGQGEGVTYKPRLGFACRLNTACFAVSLVGAFLFLISALIQVWVARHHQREKKYGPSPANNYTSGSGKRKFWQRKPKTKSNFDNDPVYAKDHEMGAVGTKGVQDHNSRPSGETGLTGTTQGVNEPTYGGATKYDNHTAGPTGTAVGHSGFHTGPTGTSVNPYGYNNNAPATGSNF